MNISADNLKQVLVMKKAKYTCTQQEVLQAAKLGWRNYSNELSRFTAFKALYTSAYRDARLAEIDAAERMADETVRSAIVKAARLGLQETAQACRDRWQDLKAYINTAYGGELEEVMLQEAGAAHYEAASNENWEEVSLLMNDGFNFIFGHQDRLRFGNNMPAGFPDMFITIKGLFANTYNDFLATEESMSGLGDQKVDACNLVFDKLSEMFFDGQKIFRRDATKKSLFTFDDVLDLLTRHFADIRGTVSTGVAHLPLAGVVVTIPELAESVVTNEEGRYDFGVIPHGNYTISIVKDGFAPQILQVEVPTGTTLTRNFELIAA